MAQKLTQRFVISVSAPAHGAATYWDSELTGFGMRVFAPTGKKPAGARSFFINYRVDGVERRLTIGAFPDWSVDAARIEARDLRRRIDRGEDPATDRRLRREAPTVKDLAERYRTEHLPKKAARSQFEDWRIIEREILPKLGHRKVADVHHGDIAALHAAITDRGAPIRANRVLAVLSKMFSLALKPAAGEVQPWRSQADGNPCREVDRNHEEGRERFFSTTEIAAVSDALELCGKTPAADCLRMIMLTGCRPSEAILATWDQFESEPGLWVKPSAHTKQRKTHRIPLNPPALQLLDRIRKERDAKKRGKGSRFVFPGQKPDAPLKQLRSTWEKVVIEATVSLWGSSEGDLARLISGLEAALGRKPSLAECEAEASRRNVDLPTGLRDARIYDLRHTFASIGAGGGLSLQIIGRLLGHTQHRTTMRYAHLGDDPLREATDKIGTVLATPRHDGADVVALGSRE